MKRQKRNGSGNPEGRTYALPSATPVRPAGSRASPCDSGNPSGGLGAAPPVIRFGGAVASPRRNKPLPKKAPAPPARGAFFPFTGSAKRPFRGTRSVSTGASIRPRSRGFRAASLPPRRGETPKAAGGHLHPLRGVPGQPRPGTGEGGAAKRPDCGPNGQQSAVASAPLTLR